MIVLMIMTMLLLAIAERAADGQVGSGIGRPPLPATKSTNHHFHPHGAGLALFGLNEEEEDDVTRIKLDGLVGCNNERNTRSDPFCFCLHLVVQEIRLTHSAARLRTWLLSLMENVNCLFVRNSQHLTVLSFAPKLGFFLGTSSVYVFGIRRFRIA